MPATYSAAIATAAAMIAKKGGPATLKRYTAGVIDPVAQTETGDRTDSYAIRAVGMPDGRGSGKSSGTSGSFESGSLVQKQRMRFYIAAKGLPITPAPGDTIVFGGVEYALTWTATYDPAGDGTIFTEAHADF